MSGSGAVSNRPGVWIERLMAVLQRFVRVLTRSRGRGAPGPPGPPGPPDPPDPPAPPRWRVIGGSVRGATHVRTGKENQDAIGWLPEEGRGDHVVLSVADGHGSRRSFRSAMGARLAIEVSHAIASELLTEERAGPELSMIKERLEDDAPRRIVRDWRSLVEQHLDEQPLSPEELDLVRGDPHLAYGSTLITAIATRTFMACWQIGDGDLVVVSAAGEADRALPRDPDQLGVETRSLCSPDAWMHFRVALFGTVSPMVLLSTDGLSTSFEDDAGFFKFGSDVAALVSGEGLDSVDSRLTAWLEETSTRGSGDDISLGIICCPDDLDSRHETREAETR